MLRSKKKYSKEVSLYEPIGTDKEGNEISLLDIIESPPIDIVENYSTREDVKLLMQSLETLLSPKEYQVICCRYGLGGEEEKPREKLQADFTSADLMFHGSKKMHSGSSRPYLQISNFHSPKSG